MGGENSVRYNKRMTETYIQEVLMWTQILSLTTQLLLYFENDYWSAKHGTDCK